MKILNVFQYAYLIFAILFIYDGITKFTEEPNKAYLSFFFAVLAVFMFFFRKRFRKKMNDNSK